MVALCVADGVQSGRVDSPLVTEDRSLAQDGRVHI